MEILAHSSYLYEDETELVEPEDSYSTNIRTEELETILNCRYSTNHFPPLKVQSSPTSKPLVEQGTMSNWTDIARTLRRAGGRKKFTTADDNVPRGTGMLRSLDHLAMHSRTPQPPIDRDHNSRYMSRHEEDRTRRWIQRPHHDYEESEMTRWGDHAASKFSTGTWLDGGDHDGLSRRPSLTPSDASGRYRPQRHHSHRSGSRIHRSRPQDRDYDRRYQEFTSHRRQSHGHSGGGHAYDLDFGYGDYSGHGHGSHRRRHHHHDHW